MREKKPLGVYWEMTKEYGRELYISCCKIKDRNAIEGFRLGMWKLRGLRKGAERGICPSCEVQENQSHILPTCREMKRWRQLFNKQRLKINKEIACGKLIRNTKTLELQNLENFLQKQSGNIKQKKCCRTLNKRYCTI
jgi:hypothetical protein